MTSLLTLLDEVSEWAGIIQVGSVQPGRKFLVPSQTSREAAQRFEALWQAVADTYNLCKLHRRAATNLQWRFEKGTLCCLQSKGEPVIAFLTSQPAAELLITKVMKRMDDLLPGQKA